MRRASFVFAAAAATVLAPAATGAAESIDVADTAGRKAGIVAIERAGEAWTAEGRTFAPFTIVVRSSAAATGRFFGTILLDGGRAGDCTWYVEVEAGASKRIEKQCRQRRPFETFSATAKVELPRPPREE